MELIDIIKKYFWLVISIYLVLGFYLLYVTYSTPYLGLEVKEDNERWIIVDPYYKQWANGNDISTGDVILKVNDVRIDDVPNVKYDNIVRAANALTILKPNGQIIEVQISNFDIPEQIYYLLIIPLCYFLLTLIIAFYLHYKQKKHTTFKFAHLIYALRFFGLC